MASIEEMLNTLAEIQAEIEATNKVFRSLADQAIPIEIKAILADIESERVSKVAPLDERAGVLTQDIKDWVLLLKESAKGDFLQAQYIKGRVSWDPKTLDGLALVVPQILSARKEGEPSVRIVPVKAKA